LASYIAGLSLDAADRPSGPPSWERWGRGIARRGGDDGRRR